MLAQLLEKHGLGARVEGADAVATSNISRLETSGVVMACVSYLDASSPAHMRYTIRRMRRKLPKPKSFLDAGWRMWTQRHFATRRNPMPSRPRCGTRSGFVWRQPRRRGVHRERPTHKRLRRRWRPHDPRASVRTREEPPQAASSSRFAQHHGLIRPDTCRARHRSAAGRAPWNGTLSPRHSQLSPPNSQITRMIGRGIPINHKSRPRPICSSIVSQSAGEHGRSRKVPARPGEHSHSDVERGRLDRCR